MLIPKKEILRLYEYIDKQVKDLLKKRAPLAKMSSLYK